jgi:hypothetical protein
MPATSAWSAWSTRPRRSWRSTLSRSDGGTSSRRRASLQDAGRNIYDSGDYPKVLDQALTMAGWDELRKMQAEARAQGRLVGIGLATAQQRSVYGPTEFWFWYDAPGLTSVPESVGLSLGPTGEFIVTMFSPFWGNSPDSRGQNVAEIQHQPDVLVKLQA